MKEIIYGTYCRRETNPLSGLKEVLFSSCHIYDVPGIFWIRCRSVC